MLNALMQYYDCLCQQDPSPLTPKGFSKVSVSYNLVLNTAGELKAILPYTQQVMQGKAGKEKPKDVPREVLLPFRKSIPGIAAETIDHREKYIFGLDYQKATKTEPGKLIHTKNSQQAFDKCKEVNLAFLTDINTPIATAYKLFVAQWTPQEGLEQPLLLAMDKNFTGAKFVISLEGTGDLLHADPQVVAKWKASLENQVIDKDAVMARCALTGELAPVARIHNNLKAIQGGMATGTNLVCFKTTAFESYGKEMAYNASISQGAMERYTEAFNFLSTSRQHKQVLDGTTFLFWAMTKEQEAPILQAVGQATGMSFEFDDDPVSAQDIAVNTAQGGLKSTFKALPAGLVSQYQAIEDMADVEFYILAVRPNTSRLAVKLFAHSTLGQIMGHADAHQLDMRLHDDDKQLSLWQMQEVLKSPVSKGELPPDLNVKLLQSVLNGAPYPRFLLDTAVSRWKVDADDKVYAATRAIRTRIIKGCLIRQHIIEREDYVMLNTQTTDSAYNCGRLFAVLEAVQSAAFSKGKEKERKKESLNATIKDKFFASACSTPNLVFPRLLKLAQHHLSKIRKETGDGLAVRYDKLITEIVSNLDIQFPKALSMEKQGQFILGYYQQKEALFTKKEEK